MTSLYDRLVAYFKGSYTELGRVIWPKWQETARLTFIVIGVSLFVAIILGVFDGFFSYLASLVSQR